MGKPAKKRAEADWGDLCSVSTPFRKAAKVALPPLRSPGRPRKYPFLTLQPGDSFYIPPAEGADRTRLVKNARRALDMLRRANFGGLGSRLWANRRFTFRRWQDGWRCWRVD
ncbi:hypothetical protein [Teichococcus aestuarii]|uniref:Uncharacterized protein n=1 Tax=Teichococcus aestuarii TaxID=568898 RepID=A0A2U1UY63_9PROT|nr:hypothetical protein [Pseudoroseomonas aestuarii]PWC26593.1 hypothetical protein CR165_22380 [Pseudoroseomonas aestuarii]